MTKTYSSKSNALRGYRSENPDCDLDNDALREGLTETDGRRTVVIADEDDADPQDDVPSCDECGHELVSEGSDCHQPECPANPEHEPELDDGEGPVVGPLRDIKGTGAYKDVPLRRRTTEAGAVSWAWSVFDAMPQGTTRKAAIAEAVRRGIAFYTARTQYQKWQHRNDVKEVAPA